MMHQASAAAGSIAGSAQAALNSTTKKHKQN